MPLPEPFFRPRFRRMAPLLLCLVCIALAAPLQAAPAQMAPAKTAPAQAAPARPEPAQTPWQPTPVPQTPLTGEAAEAVLARLRAGSKSLTTLRADFIQEKHLSMFSQNLVSHGKFSFRAPDSLRWEYTSPVPSGFIVTGGKGAAWSAAGGEMHKSGLRDSPEFSTLADQIGIWLAFDEEAIKRQYSVEVLSASPAVIRLTPKNDTVRRFLRGLILFFAPDDSVAQEVHILEGAGGDTTVLRFSNAVRGETLPDSLFTP